MDPGVEPPPQGQLVSRGPVARLAVSARLGPRRKSWGSSRVHAQHTRVSDTHAPDTHMRARGTQARGPHTTHASSHTSVRTAAGAPTVTPLDGGAATPKNRKAKEECLFHRRDGDLNEASVHVRTWLTWRPRPRPRFCSDAMAPRAPFLWPARAPVGGGKPPLPGREALWLPD